MSKKHFQALADMIKGLSATLKESDRWIVAVSLAVVCEGFNANFDRARFLAACGFEGEL